MLLQVIQLIVKERFRCHCRRKKSPLS